MILESETAMSHETKANSVLEQARGIASVVGSWAEFSNALFGHEAGAIPHTFTDPMEYQSFLDSKQYAEICTMLRSLMEKFGIARGSTPSPKSGKFVVRIPKSLHALLDVESKVEGVSLNQLALTKLSWPLRDRHTSLDVSVVAKAYKDVFDGYSTDRVVVDPALNKKFLQRCTELGVWGSAYRLNHCLLDIRKSTKADLPKATKRTQFRDMDEYRFASEIAVRTLERTKGVTLDRIFCDPDLASEFDKHARSLVDERSALKLRWAALNLRKTHQLSPMDSLGMAYDLASTGPIRSIRLPKIPALKAVYVLLDTKRPLFAGETDDLRERIRRHLDKGLPSWIDRSDDYLTLSYHSDSSFKQADRLRWLRWFINSERPVLNYQRSA